MTPNNASEIKYSAGNLHNDTCVAIIVSKWHSEITNSLYEGAISVLEEYGVREIKKYEVPGSFELSFAASHLASYGCYDCIICLGVVIRGETKHFDFICNAVANGITKASIQNDVPVIFGVLTPDNLQQAIDRSGGKYGNKGAEAAVAALEMVDFMQEAVNHYNFISHDIEIPDEE